MICFTVIYGSQRILLFVIVCVCAHVPWKLGKIVSFVQGPVQFLLNIMPFEFGGGIIYGVINEGD